MSLSWDKKYLALALFIAGWSKDSTKVGAVIVGDTNQVNSLGFNGPARGIDDDVPARWERPAKYQWCEHAERNAIYNAARSGMNLMASTMYIASYPAKFTPCIDCARAIIQSGIARVVHEPTLDVAENWQESFRIANEMMLEAGIEIDCVDLSC